MSSKCFKTLPTLGSFLFSAKPRAVLSQTTHQNKVPSSDLLYSGFVLPDSCIYQKLQPMLDWVPGWLVFVNLTQNGVIFEEGGSMEKMPPPEWPVGKPVQQVLIDNGCGRIQLTMGGSTPGQVVLAA